MSQIVLDGLGVRKSDYIGEVLSFKNHVNTVFPSREEWHTGVVKKQREFAVYTVQSHRKALELIWQMN